VNPHLSHEMMKICTVRFYAGSCRSIGEFFLRPSLKSRLELTHVFWHLSHGMIRNPTVRFYVKSRRIWGLFSALLYLCVWVEPEEWDLMILDVCFSAKL